MKGLLTLVLLAGCAHAATVQGVIFDEETTIPIARTHVSLIPLPGTAGAVVDLLANDHGLYAFPNVQPGFYLIRATRIGFEPAEFGQMHPGLPGAPLEITAQSSDNDLHQIIMRRQAAIAGSVVDDNAVGIAGWGVSIYTAKQPIRRIAQATTDDRGNFRVGELERGTYIVRAGGGGLEDASTLIPSYFKYGTTVDGAERIFVRLGETQSYAVVHTVPGQLFEITGNVNVAEKQPIRVTLITDTGRRVIANSGGPFTASGVPPGTVAILAESAGCASYQTLLVDRNMYAKVDCNPIARPVVTGALTYPLIARRIDLDGPGREFAVGQNDVLNPGPWEFTVRPEPTHYLAGIQNEASNLAASFVDGWFGFTAGNSPQIRVTLSTKPASISGAVSSGGKPVIGAPVALQLVNPAAPELALQTWSIRADPQGHFVFSSLAPGTYRMMSSFDVDYDEPIARDRSVTLSLKEGDTPTQNLELLKP